MCIRKVNACLGADNKPVLCLSVTGALCLLAIPRLKWQMRNVLQPPISDKRGHMLAIRSCMH